MTKTPSETELLQRIEELENLWKRAHADYQNLEKRVEQERMEQRKKIIKDVVKVFLPIFATLKQASEHIQDAGLTIVVKQLFGTLTALGIEQIVTVGKAFDPKEMDAVDTRESREDGKVVEELASGYRYGDMLIQPAKVVVGKKPQGEEKTKNTQSKNATTTDTPDE